MPQYNIIYYWSFSEKGRRQNILNSTVRLLHEFNSILRFPGCLWFITVILKYLNVDRRDGSLLAVFLLDNFLLQSGNDTWALFDIAREVPCPIERNYPSFLLDKVRKSTDDFSQHSRFLNQHSNRDFLNTKQECQPLDLPVVVKRWYHIYVPHLCKRLF
jgi:hypothetical protein